MNFRRHKMPLINYKIHLKLDWIKNCVMSDVAGNTTFKITNTKLYILILTLSTKDNKKLPKELNERCFYWDE